MMGSRKVLKMLSYCPLFYLKTCILYFNLLLLHKGNLLLNY